MRLRTKVVVVTETIKDSTVSLSEELDGSVSLLVNGYYVVTIEHNGRLNITSGVPEGIGLDVDKYGKIQIDGR